MMSAQRRSSLVVRAVTGGLRISGDLPNSRHEIPSGPLGLFPDSMVSG